MGSSQKFLFSGGRYGNEIEGAFFIAAVTWPVIRIGCKNVGHFFVQCAQRDVRGTGFLTQSAIDAASGHVDRAGQMKDGIFRGQQSRLDEVGFFQTALLAKAHGADIAAAIAFDATIEMLHPVPEALCQGEVVDVFHRGIVGDSLRFFTDDTLIRVRLGAFAGHRQFPRTGNADRDDPFAIQLFPLEEFDQTPFVATSHQHREGGFGGRLGQSNQGLVQREPDVTGFILIAQGEFAQFLLLGEEVRLNVSVSFPQSQETLDFSFFQQLFHQLNDFFSHRLFSPCFRPR
jgi:hypothetical protein